MRKNISQSVILETQKMSSKFYKEEINEPVTMASSGDIILEFLANKEMNRFQVKHIPTDFAKRYGSFEVAFQVYEECAHGLIAHDLSWQHLYPVYQK